MSKEDGFDINLLDVQGLSRCMNSACSRMACQRKTASGLAMTFEGGADCLFYVLHDTITDERKIFRGGGKRHNAHAFQPSRGPNLMVRRHIRGGEDINAN